MAEPMPFHPSLSTKPRAKCSEPSSKCFIISKYLTICSSVPTYGTGHEPGNEAGYIVGMSTCYPSPGSVKISAGETLTLVSDYSSAQRHTGVMGLFYILIADSSAKMGAIEHSPAQVGMSTMASYLGWPIALFGIGLVLALVLIYSGRNGYEEI